MPVREGTNITMVPAAISMFRIGGDGKLEFVRKYDIDATVQKQQFWAGMREGQVLLVDDGSCPAGQLARSRGLSAAITSRWAVQNRSCEPAVAFPASTGLRR
jgi:hypothetical protein